MSDTPKKPGKKPNPIDRAKEPVSVEKDKVFEIYRSIHHKQGEVTIRAVLAEIQKKDPNAKISASTIRKWAVAHGWRDRVDQEIKEDLHAKAKRYGPGIETDVVRGLQGLMVLRLYEALEKMEIVSLGGMVPVVECLAVLNGINGGTTVNATKDAASPTTRPPLKEILGEIRQLRPKQ